MQCFERDRDLGISDGRGEYVTQVTVIGDRAEQGL